MKKIYKSSPATIAVLLIVVLFLLAGPLIAVFIEDVKDDELLIVLGICYLAFSPLTLLLAWVLKKNIQAKIIITGDSISYGNGSGMINIPWGDLDRFVFDYVRTGNNRDAASHFFVIYEISSGDTRFRFNRLMTEAEINREDEICLVSSFKRKSYRFEAYGLYFKKKVSDSLVNDIRDYSGIEPVRERKFF